MKHFTISEMLKSDTAIKQRLWNGAINSQHMRGEAADIRPVKSEKLKVKSELDELVRILIANGKFDQLIIYPTFIHVSWKRNGTNRHVIARNGA